MLALTGALAAAEKPNFTGTWKLNADKSDYGGRPGGPAVTVKVDHQEPAFTSHVTVHRDGDPIVQEFKAKTDGKVYYDTYGPQSCTMKWEGDVILMEMFDGAGNLLNSNRIRLEKTGKVMFREGVIKTGGGDVKIREVWEKQ
ncbi:MAG: hypothetical protein SFV54_20175 [Bryobacteraceae bacterium]|nr:hypothetical protein [Bryobacteraceae bacterium]